MSAISDPYLRAAFWTALAAVAATLSLSVLIVVLRLRLRAREHRWQDFVARWRPALLAATLEPGPGAPLPPLQAREHLMFLRLWAYLQESLRGETAKRLNDTARGLGLEATTRRLLAHGSRPEQLQAILAAGYLRDAATWDRLVEIARSPDSLLAVNAARALVGINPLRAANGLLPLLLTRTDWDLSRVATLLGDARQAFWLLLAKLIPMLQPAELPRALLLAQALRLQLPEATVARLLQADHPASVLEAALRLSDSPGLVADVRRCLRHTDAGVRKQAALQMGGVAARDDVSDLVALLGDAEWRVRLAAAQTLARLPFLDDAGLQALALRHPAAEPLLRHAIAERRLA